MRILKPMQTGVLTRPFAFAGREILCVSLLWAFRLESGEPILETEMWPALTDLFREGRTFDQCMPKARSEFLCLGAFHAPQGEAVAGGAVSVRVGHRTKKLLVSGPREWRAGWATRAEPITTLPIRYDQAFGGPGFQDNPIGKGYAKDREEGRRPLPCVEYPDQAVGSPRQEPRPASLEPRDLTWRPRQRYAGTYDEEYIRTRMTALADDVDWRVFNDGAEDQWFDQPLRGDEPYEIVNMHPQRQGLSGHLPGVIGRAFIECKREPERRESELAFAEVPLQLDTVWLLPDAEMGVVIHRGTAEIAERDGSDVVNLLAAHENMADSRRPVSHYRDEMTKRSDPDEGYRYMLDTRPLLPVGCPCALQEMAGTAAEQTQQPLLDNMANHTRRQQERLADEGGLESGSDAPQSADEQEINRILEKAAPGATSGDQVDIAAIDFSAFDELKAHGERMAQRQRSEAEQGLRERIAELRRQNEPEQPELTRAIAEMEQRLAAMQEPPQLPRPWADAGSARARRDLEEMEQQADELRVAGIDEGRIESTVGDTAQLRAALDATVRRTFDQYREAAHYMGACRSPHPGREGDLRARLLERAGAREVPDPVAPGDLDFAFVDLSGCTLRDLDLSDACLEYVDFTGATLVRVNLAGAILAGARLHRCRFEEVDLTNANIGATSIHEAEFIDCDCTRARFGQARIAVSRFQRCRFLERPEIFVDAEFDRARFEECALVQTTFVERDLAECGFRGCDLTKAMFTGCDLRAADFSGADLTRTHFVESRAPGARFDGATMANIGFIKEPVLNDCSFREATLHTANLRAADLAGADFTAANLEGADLSGADLSGACLDRVQAVGAQFRGTQMARARLHKANLREASLMDARIQQARFNGANLYSVSFIGATLGDTGFSDAILDNTILRDWRPLRG